MCGGGGFRSPEFSADSLQAWRVACDAPSMIEHHQSGIPYSVKIVSKIKLGQKHSLITQFQKNNSSYYTYLCMLYIHYLHAICVFYIYNKKAHTYTKKVFQMKRHINE